MSNIVKGLTVALEQDVSDEYAECISRAILQIRGVADVGPVLADSSDWINRRQIRGRIWDRVRDIILDDKP